MKGRTCCVTGHRDLPQKEINRVKAALGHEVDKAIADGYTCFMSGFAEGVDQFFAEIVLERRKGNPALELIAVIPYQKRRDSLNKRRWTCEMLEACADVIVVQEEYHPSLSSSSVGELWQYFVPNSSRETHRQTIRFFPFLAQVHRL